jgi:hypothetical protein
MKMQIGTLKELNVKPGDVVRHKDDSTYEVRLRNGAPYLWWITEYGDTPSQKGWGVSVDSSFQEYRIISRAPETPKLWRDMTGQEKGALLLAAHEGNVIEVWHGKWLKVLSLWGEDRAYRIRPEPKRETVRVAYLDKYGREYEFGYIDTIDGKPDPASIRMDEI